jgi:hypothetical protein
VRFAASVLLLGLAIYAVLNLRGRRGQKALICAATLPILIGYFFLQMRGALNGTNASYDAYKLFCVFYPGILAALAFWLTWARRGSAPIRILITTCAVLVVVANLWTDWRFVRRMRNPPLMVDRSILALRSLEKVPQVDSLNLRITDFWARLWANSFLLRKPHFFPSYTYEGRRNTELKGKWDLTGGIATIHLSSQAKADELKLPAPYSVLNTAAPDYVRVSLGEGWHEPEFICRNALRWQWTRGNASLVVHNPHTTPLSLALRLRVRSIVARDLQVWLNGQQIGLYEVGPEMSHLRQKGVTLPRGDSLLEFRSNVEPVLPGAQDRRRLGTAVFALELDVKALEK